MHYFVRVNGDSGHNDPSRPDAYVPREPPLYPAKSFNYVHYCLEQSVIRIGWPDTGDLRGPQKSGALANAYDLDSIEPRHRGYLLQFRDIDRGAVILMPNPKVRGQIFIGDVVTGYEYFHEVPKHPYECAHRLGVVWDRHADDKGTSYDAEELGIHLRGGFWRSAFAVLERVKGGARIIERIRVAHELPGARETGNRLREIPKKTL